MIKAIFEKEFLELSKRIDNTLELTNYVIGSRYSKDTELTNAFIKNLFNGSYILSDTRQTASYPMNSIWEKEDKLLRICIRIDDSEKEKLVEPTNEYDFIYCYAKYPDGVEKIAIVLVSLGEDGKSLAPLDLNISDNLVELSFPESVVSTIFNAMDSDTEFLEGIGIISGINIFNIPEEDPRKEQLVTRKSYYKYLRNTVTGGESISLIYNNIYGERICGGGSERRIYKSVTLSSLEPVDSLSPNGGYIRLLGKATYILPDSEVEGDCDIINLPYIVDISVEENTGMSIEVWRDKKKLKYGKNTGEGDLSAVIKLKITNTDGSVVESRPLLLTQKK